MQEDDVSFNPEGSSSPDSSSLKKPEVSVTTGTDKVAETKEKKRHKLTSRGDDSETVRKQKHNRVEKRRRVTENNALDSLKGLVSPVNHSKGGVLESAVARVKELNGQNADLRSSIQRLKQCNTLLLTQIRSMRQYMYQRTIAQIQPPPQEYLYPPTNQEVPLQIQHGYKHPEDVIPIPLSTSQQYPPYPSYQQQQQVDQLEQQIQNQLLQQQQLQYYDNLQTQPVT